MTGLDQQLDDQLNDQLNGLAGRIAAPEVPVAADLARGRRRVRRARVLAAGAAVATVAAVGAGAGAAQGLFDADGAPGYTDRTASPHPVPTEPSGDATPALPARVEITPSRGAVPLPHSMGLSPQQQQHTLAAWQRVLAEHLDPQWQHLVKYDAKTNGNVQYGSTGDTLTSLGSKYGWQAAGESGLGMLQVSVNAGWDGVYWSCEEPAAGWDCHTARGPHDEKARVARHDGVLEVAVEHPDGQVVVLTADSLFGNNSTVPVSGIDVSEQALLAAAADPRLSLPGGPPQMPPLVGAHVHLQVGLAALEGEGEVVRIADAGGGTNPWARATWTASNGKTGRLEWTAVPHVGGDAAADYTCPAAQFTDCALEAVDGHQVFVGHLRAKAGGGWHVRYAGPSYTVMVTFHPDSPGVSFPIERAEALALDDRLQPGS